MADILLVMNALFLIYATSSKGGRTPCSEWTKSATQFLRRPNGRVQLHTIHLGSLKPPLCYCIDGYV